MDEGGGGVVARVVAPMRWGRAAAGAFAALVLPLAAAAVVRISVAEPFEYEGPSMTPAIADGERFVVDKGAYGLMLPYTERAITTWRTPRLGQVVALRSPSDRVTIVKRVVGIAGDVVELRAGVVFRNGAAVEATPIDRCQAAWCQECDPVRETLGGHVYATVQCRDPADDVGPVHVPPGHVFVLGDNRARSNDSRFFGPVPVSALVGRATFLYYSPDSRRIGAPIP